MRDSKFRAFDKRKKVWVAEGFHIFGECTLFGLIQIYCLENRENGECSLERMNEIEVTEFTGLKDKNGKDLYEGDVLRTLHFQTESTINYMFHKVVYDEVRGTFNAINVMNKDEEITTNGNCFLYVALKDKTCEVIGNVFETPELLKV